MRFNNISVLIVSSDQCVCDQLESDLRSGGLHRIFTAQAPENAVDPVKHQATDIVLVNDKPPELDAIKFVCENFKPVDRRRPGAGIFVLLEKKSKSRTMAAFHAGATEVLVKPFDACRLMNRIHCHCVSFEDLMQFAAETAASPGTSV